LDNLVEIVAEASEGGEEEEVTGFGKLVLRSRAKVREGDNPKIKEVMLFRTRRH
jgi:nucleoid DNA-binding protein